MTVKPRTNFYLDLLLLILMGVVLISGVVLWVGPSGGEGQHQGRRWQDAGAVSDQSERTLILNRQDWKTIHVWLGLVTGGVILIHLIFHWKWLVCRLRADLLGQSPSHTRELSPH